MEGKATDLSFFSSARARQFFTVLSSISSHLSVPQPGLLQWITYLAGRPKPAVNTAERRGEERMVNHYEGKRKGNRDTRRRRTGKQVRINTMLAQHANVFSLVAMMRLFFLNTARDSFSQNSQMSKLHSLSFVRNQNLQVVWRPKVLKDHWLSGKCPKSPGYFSEVGCSSRQQRRRGKKEKKNSKEGEEKGIK